MTASRDDQHLLARPIIIIGAARSGTTLLGKILRQHHQVFYIEEPRMVWRYRNDGLSDMFQPEHARPDVVNSIRSTFANWMRSADHSPTRLVEKTPSNALRMGFVDRVFPDALYIHILRNGVDSVLSLNDLSSRYGGGVTDSRMRHIAGVRVSQMRLRQYPYYAGEFLRRLLPERLAGPREWGPRFPGIRAMLRERGRLETSAVQWRMCVELACGFGRSLPADRYLECRLEDMSVQLVQSIMRFCGLPEDSAVTEFVEREFDQSMPGTRRANAEPADIERIRPWIASTMAWLGYAME